MGRVWGGGMGMALGFDLVGSDLFDGNGIFASV